MARVELNNAAKDLEVIVRKMRVLGVASWANSPIGDIVLGKEPPPESPKTDVDPKAERRAHYVELLGRPVTDAELEKLP